MKRGVCIVGLLVLGLVACKSEGDTESTSESTEQQSLEERVCANVTSIIPEEFENDDDCRRDLERMSESCENADEMLECFAAATDEDSLGACAAMCRRNPEQARSERRRAEAPTNLRRLYDGAVAYYQTPHVTITGDFVPAQFPDSVGLTPAEVPRGELATPSGANWDNDTWMSLNFALSDPHAYSYQFDSSGTDRSATFTASAFGDLDGDGVLSTFVRTGSVNAAGEVRGGAGLYVENEDE